MNITILVKGHKTRIAKRLSLRRIVSACVLISLVLLVSSRTTESVYENQVRLNVVTTGLKAQAQEIQQLKQDTHEQVGSVVSELASMRAKIEYLDALSASLAKSNDLSPEDFTLQAGASVNESTISPSANTATDGMSALAIDAQIDAMSDKLDYKIKQLEALESILLGLNIEHESKLAGRPVQKGWLSSHYGMRKDPFSGRPAMHKGVDFAGEAGAGVIATAAGIVTWSGERSGYGNLIEIDHGNGYKTRYGHNKELSVEVGDVVTKGQVVAKMGSTGRSTGVHVHYEVLKNGKQVDPLPFIYR